ncbi:MAG: hypothetical protein ACRC4N_08905 [Gammaproteobacteria bacterium]
MHASPTHPARTQGVISPVTGRPPLLPGPVCVCVCVCVCVSVSGGKR